MTDEQIKVIVGMYLDGASFARIAKEIGVTDNVVKHWVRVNRPKYALPRRRNRADKTGVMSYAAETDCCWNVQLSLAWITKKWGRAA